ncbi:hypothetical protein ACFXTO_007788 [Malus domestica]
MDFAVLYQLKQKRLYHIEMSIRFPPTMRWTICNPLFILYFLALCSSSSVDTASLEVDSGDMKVMRK